MDKSKGWTAYAVKVLASYMMKYPDGNYIPFKKVPGKVMRGIIERGAADPEGTQNDSPSLDSLTRLCESYPKLTLHGYLITDARADERVTAEGVNGEVPLKEFFDEILGVCRQADEFEAVLSEDGKYVTVHIWWD